MNVYVYIFMYIFIFVYIYINVYIYIYVYIYIFEFIYINVYICNNIKPNYPCLSQVVGAGVAGLVCARSLHRSGRCRVEVFEAADGVGGRVRSDRVPLPGPGITT